VGLECRVWGAGCRVWDLSVGCGVQGVGYRAQGAGCRLYGGHLVSTQEQCSNNDAYTLSHTNKKTLSPTHSPSLSHTLTHLPYFSLTEIDLAPYLATRKREFAGVRCRAKRQQLEQF
jgi:hypothetical protein